MSLISSASREREEIIHRHRAAKAIFGMTKNTDPHDIPQHAPGAKLDAGKPRIALMMDGFAEALLEVGKVTTFGAAKYTDHGWREVPNGIERYTSAMYRHALSRVPYDDESGLHHAAHAAWCALARLQLILQQEQEDAPASLAPSEDFDRA